jgi:hypothetical protein
LIHWTGLRDFGYVMNAAKPCYKYWSICDGKCSFKIVGES